MNTISKLTRIKVAISASILLAFSAFTIYTNHYDHQLDQGVLFSRQGRASFAAHRYSDAIRQLNKANRLNPELQAPYKYLGETYERVGRIGDAVIAYKEYVRQDPGDTEVLGLLQHAVNVQNKALSH